MQHTQRALPVGRENLLRPRIEHCTVRIAANARHADHVTVVGIQHCQLFVATSGKHTMMLTVHRHPGRLLAAPQLPRADHPKRVRVEDMDDVLTLIVDEGVPASVKSDLL